jgi:hypothetical protein
VTPSPNTRHQRLVRRLLAAFEDHLRLHPDAGEPFVAPFDVVFGQLDVVEPDLLFIAADAGFAWTGTQLADQAEESDAMRRKHRNVALASMGVSVVSWSMMLLFK